VARANRAPRRSTVRVITEPGVIQKRNPKGEEVRKPDTALIRWSVTRREFVVTAGSVVGGVALGWAPFAGASRAAQEAGPLSEAPHATRPGPVPVALTINGKRHELSLDPRVTLLDLLRNDLDLTGTKKGCDHGQCGACTVLANGRRINSCLSLAAAHQGEEIVTIEGLALAGRLHPMQEAFLEHDGMQCGYCTPGQICSAVAMLDEARAGESSFVTREIGAPGAAELTPAEIRERMSGNICRCGAYPGIIAAVESVWQGSGANHEGRA
jgi:xanthine dehydrogenase YagT iron-sulfur-binding subunit